MRFKNYDQNQLMIPMERKKLVDKNNVIFAIDEIIEKMNVDKISFISQRTEKGFYSFRLKP